jgi:hypothetical protein
VCSIDTPEKKKIFSDNILLNNLQGTWRGCSHHITSPHSFPFFDSISFFKYTKGWNERHGRHLFKPKAESLVPSTTSVTNLPQASCTFRSGSKTSCWFYCMKIILRTHLLCFCRTRVMDRHPLWGQIRRLKSVDILVIQLWRRYVPLIC